MARVGLDPRPFLHSRDSVERLVEVVVAARAADFIVRDRRIERENLAAEVGNHVGRIVGRALNELARAMR